MAVTERASERALQDGRPRDLMLGDDVLEWQTQTEVLDDLDRTNPYCVIVGFPCDPFSPMTNMQPPTTVRQKRIAGYQHLLFVARVWLNCRKRGGHLLLENPL
eukprot:3154204-Heterocapsa_arctica.AAC.1